MCNRKKMDAMKAVYMYASCDFITLSRFHSLGNLQHIYHMADGEGSRNTHVTT